MARCLRFSKTRDFLSVGGGNARLDDQIRNATSNKVESIGFVSDDEDSRAKHCDRKRSSSREACRATRRGRSEGGAAAPPAHGNTKKTQCSTLLPVVTYLFGL